MKRLSLVLAAAIVFAMASAASAQVLWDQSDFDAFGPGFFNADAGSPPFGSNTHTVNHVTAPGAWNITKITAYFTGTDPGFAAGIFQGYLHIWPKVGPMPSEDPTASPLVLMTGTLQPGPNGDYIEVSTVDLDINITSGEYWIGITPIGTAGPFGPEFQMASLSSYGDASATYDVFGFPMPMWMNMNPGVDAAILIEGSGPVPNDSRSVGSMKAQFDN
mgnify:CR=1 FL=1